jgi:transposase-like protein
MTSTRCGISAKQLERELGVTYKTAWRMFKLIRSLMADDSRGPLTGTVEIDETYFTRSKRNRPAEPKKSGYSPGERAVLGMVERGGRVVVRHVPDARTATVDPHIKAHVMPETMVFTDKARTYVGLKRKGYPHKRINHEAKVYVKGDIHTQTIEGFWSTLKRGISGIYHSVGSGYLQSYIDEYVWRYNRRADGRAMFRRWSGKPRPWGSAMPRLVAEFVANTRSIGEAC